MKARGPLRTAYVGIVHIYTVRVQKMTSLCFVFLVFAGVFVVSHARKCTTKGLCHTFPSQYLLSAENITIEGNDEQLISGLEQDITCSFTGRQNVTLIEWVVVVRDLEFTAAKDTSGASVLVLTLTPGLSSDGSQFKCRVIDSSGRNYEKNITISVKSKFTGKSNARTHLM